MTIRKQSDLPIWLFSRTEAISKVNRIIYLQLGADGVLIILMIVKNAC